MLTTHGADRAPSERTDGADERRLAYSELVVKTTWRMCKMWPSDGLFDRTGPASHLLSVSERDCECEREKEGDGGAQRARDIVFLCVLQTGRHTSLCQEQAKSQREEAVFKQ